MKSTIALCALLSFSFAGVASAAVCPSPKQIQCSGTSCHSKDHAWSGEIDKISSSANATSLFNVAIMTDISTVKNKGPVFCSYAVTTPKGTTTIASVSNKEYNLASKSGSGWQSMTNGGGYQCYPFTGSQCAFSS